MKVVVTSFNLSRANLIFFKTVLDGGGSPLHGECPTYIHVYIKYIYIYIYIYIYTYRVSHKMGTSHIGNGEWIKGNKKFLYYFEILAIVFELEKEISKPICD